MKKYDCKVILCGPAIGKTYLAEHDSNFIDIDGTVSKYKYNLNNQDFEKDKLNRGEIINKDYKEYGINLLNKTINEGKIALISYHEYILDYLIENNIDYCLVYTDINLREEYIDRMRKRGNSEEFIYEMTNEEAWNNFHIKDKNDTKPKYKIILKKGQYLSDIKQLFK